MLQFYLENKVLSIVYYIASHYNLLFNPLRQLKPM